MGCDNIFTYAPSCNTTTIEEFNKFHKNGIDFSMFKNLSARDLNTKKLLEEISNRKVTLVLDPTMLYENMLSHAVEPNASYVVTATFHGTIFSILCKRQFVSCASLGYKIQDLLKRFELESRDSSESDNIIEMIDKEIDYDNVERLLKEKRKESMDYLTKALKGE